MLRARLPLPQHALHVTGSLHPLTTAQEVRATPSPGGGDGIVMVEGVAVHIRLQGDTAIISILHRLAIT